MNDLRPVSLTSVPMKCLEKLVVNILLTTFACLQDPLQFAYRAKRSVEDAILTFLNNTVEPGLVNHALVQLPL